MFKSKVMQVLVVAALLSVIAASVVIVMGGGNKEDAKVVDSVVVNKSSLADEKAAVKLESATPPAVAKQKEKPVAKSAEKADASKNGGNEGGHVSRFETESRKRLYKDI